MRSGKGLAERIKTVLVFFNFQYFGSISCIIQGMAQSEKDSHSKNRAGKKTNLQ